MVTPRSHILVAAALFATLALPTTSNAKPSNGPAAPSDVASSAYVSITMSLVAEDGLARARAYVEVIDADNEPLKSARVTGRFSGPLGVLVLEAETNVHGVVLMTSEEAPLDSAWSFHVDAVAPKVEGEYVAGEAVPRGFARLGRSLFGQMSVFSTVRADGDEAAVSDAGVSPFVLAIPADELLLLAEAGVGLGPTGQSAVPIESLMVRGFGKTHGEAPFALVASRSAVASQCIFADSPVMAAHVADAGVSPFIPSDAGVSPFIPSDAGVSPFIPSDAGVSPFIPSDAGVSPFIPSDAGVSPFSRLTSPSGDADTVMVRDEGDWISYYLNGENTALGDIGANATSPGIITAGLADTGCPESSWLVSDIERFGSPSPQAQTVSMHWDVSLILESSSAVSSNPVWQSAWDDIATRAATGGVLSVPDQLWQAYPNGLITSLVSAWGDGDPIPSP